MFWVSIIAAHALYECNNLCIDLLNHSLRLDTIRAGLKDSFLLIEIGQLYYSARRYQSAAAALHHSIAVVQKDELLASAKREESLYQSYMLMAKVAVAQNRIDDAIMNYDNIHEGKWANPSQRKEALLGAAEVLEKNGKKSLGRQYRAKALKA